METQSKPCCTCKEMKPLTEFYRDKGQPDGLEWRCKACRKAAVKSTRKKYRERYTARTNAWGKANRERCRQHEQRAYRKAMAEEPWKIREKMNARRAARVNATPKWVDHAVLREIYKNCPEGYHVDHIYPLRHPDMCGLHVPWNLTYLPAGENIRKSNKLPEEL